MSRTPVRAADAGDDLPHGTRVMPSPQDVSILVATNVDVEVDQGLLVMSVRYRFLRLSLMVGGDGRFRGGGGVIVCSPPSTRRLSLAAGPWDRPPLVEFRTRSSRCRRGADGKKAHPHTFRKGTALAARRKG